MDTPTMSPEPGRAGPIPAEERIAVLDILRGFALLGICIINLGDMKTPSAAWNLNNPRFPGLLDQATVWAIEAFGSGKFNAIFSFLFGVGLTIQLGRAEARGAPVVGLYLRRLAVLLVLGVAHALLLWSGDVLHVYAVLGLALLLLRRMPDAAVLGLIVGLLVGPMVREAVDVARDAPPGHDQVYYQARMAEQLRIYGRGSYGEMVRDRAATAREEYGENLEFGFFGDLGVTMLLGFLAGRRRVFRDLPASLPLVRRVFRLTLVPGLICALTFATADQFDEKGRRTWLDLAVQVAYVLNRPLLSLAYISGITLLAESPGWRGRLGPLRSVGRMPLTNYLMQSVIATTIFYSYGLGLFGKVGASVGLPIALAIYAVQVLYSHWWMARFRFGPLEWLWRAVTYGTWPEFRIRRHEPGPEARSL